MAPGPNFYEQSARRTDPLKITTTCLSEASIPEPAKRVELNAAKAPAPVESPSRSATPNPSAPVEAPTDSPVPKVPVAQKPRKNVPSMCDYLSLEQLEDLWSTQDMYKGTVEAPTRSKPRRFTAAQIKEARAQIGDLPVHPAFRDYSQIVS